MWIYSNPRGMWTRNVRGFVKDLLVTEDEMKILSEFKSFFKAKSKKQTHDERIGFLANELIKELKASGRRMRSHSLGHGVLTIWVHRLGKEDATLEIEHDGYQRIITKPTFTEF